MSAPNLIKCTLNAYMADVSAPSSVWIPIPTGFDGKVTEIRTCLGGAITGANSVVTAKVAGTAMTNGTITVAYSGSAAGDVGTCYPSSANAVAAGSAIEIATDGASSTTQPLYITVVITR